MRISNKTRMYELLEQSFLGNRFRIWKSEQEYTAAVEAGFEGLVGVRCVGTVGLPYFHHKTYEEAIKIGRRLKEEYRFPVRYYEASPDEFILIQGEFVEADHGPMLEWSTARTHMREALAQERHTMFGLGVRLLLKSVLTENSYNDLLVLGQIYPNAIIEFTAYEIFVGDQELFPGRNHVVWECRHY